MLKTKIKESWIPDDMSSLKLIFVILVTWSDPMLLRLFSCGSASFRDDSEVVRGFWVESWDGGGSGGARLWLDGAEVWCDAEFGLRWAWELWALHLDIKALKIQWHFYYALICKAKLEWKQHMIISMYL